MNKLKKRMMVRCTLTMLTCTFLIIGIIVLAEIFISSEVIVCDYDSILYRVLHIIKENIELFLFFMIFAVNVITACLFISKACKYTEETVNAAKSILTCPENPVELSADIKNVQDTLNQIREVSNRNALNAKTEEKRKNDLVVYLAHDLKTPLTSIIGYMTLLRDEKDISPETREKYTQTVVKKAERLEELINEFFEITRFNLSSMELRLKKINFSLMLEQITYEFQPILSEKSLTCTINAEPDIMLVCDSDKIERVIDNLIRNAVNYSYPDTDIKMNLYKENDNVVLVCSNHGKTIPKDKLNRIFEQFFRADNSRSTSTGGSGLGLAISKQIVEAHGGKITAESQNENISFTAEFPLNL